MNAASNAGLTLILGAAAALAAAQGVAAQPASGAAATSGLTAYPGGKWQPGPAQYGAMTVEDVPVTMDDGAVLMARVTYPADLTTSARASGKFPVVIEQTPYLHRPGDSASINYLAGHGYIYVKAWARGSNKSGGEMAYFAPRDGLDGKAIVDWAAHRLEGSDGRIALLGCSWPGGLALTTAATVGPNSPVKAAIAACVGLTGLQRQTYMVSGLPTTRMRTSPDLLPAVGNTPSAGRVLGKLLEDMAAGADPAYDRDFWRERRPLAMAQRVVDNGIPLLLWTGWQDFVDVGAMRTYVGLQNAAAGRPLGAPMVPGQKVTPRYQIVAGGWGHTGALDASVYLQWFETWLKGVDTGLQRTAKPMHLFEGGTGRWVNIAGFPAVQSYTRMFLDGSGKMQAGAPKGAASKPLNWDDPDGPDGKLTFTAPVAGGMTLTGPISATVYASSSNANLALIAKLFDVAADGKATEITRGAVLGSLRELDKANNWTDSKGVVTWPWPKLVKDDPLVPGKVYRFDIALAPRHWGIAPGHSLRFELTTQSSRKVCPLDGPPPGTSTEICGLTLTQQKTVPGGKYRVFFGDKLASSLNLPKLPWKAFAEVRTGPAPMPANALRDQGVIMPLDWAK